MRKTSSQDQYIRNLFGMDDTILHSIEVQLEKDHKDGIQISASDALILQFLIRSLKVKTIVEIGTLYGYSALCMARALPENGRLLTLDSNLQHTEMAQRLLEKDPHFQKITFQTVDARQGLQYLQGPFDMVFIDANKSAYLDYLDWAINNTTRGGLIVGDNTFLFGGVYGESRNERSNQNQIKVMVEFNRRLADQNIFESCLIPTSEGLTVGIRK